MENFVKKVRAFFKQYCYNNRNSSNGSDDDDNKEKFKPKNFKNLLLLCLTALIIIYIVSMLMTKMDQTEWIKYPDFMELLENDQVETVFYDPNDEYMFIVLKPADMESPLYASAKEAKLQGLDVRRTYYPDTPEFREMILKTGTDIIIEKNNQALNTLVSALPGILFIAFYIMLIMKVGKPFQDVKEADLIQTSDVSFDDIIGHDEILDDVKFVTALLKEPELGENIGVKMPKGLLFTGPPGTGKTLIAKAIAHEANVPFLYQNASGLIEMYVGLGARRVRNLFKIARDNAPCVLFIDEIDAVGTSRSSHKGTSENEQTINALLQEMDGFSSKEGIFVIAATNRADALDSALTRAGRFDRQINVLPPPDWQTRKKLFDHYLEPLATADDLDTEVLSKQSPGFTGADIAAICNEAGIIAAMNHAEVISLDCVEEAMDKKIFKGNRSKTQKYEKDREIIAYHEAGHAVMSLLLGEPVARASIQSTTSGVGGAVFNEDKESTFMTDAEMRNRVLIAYAGRASEEIKFHSVTTGATNDITQATQVMMKYIESLGFDKEFGLLDIEVLTQQHLINSDMITEKLSKMSKELYAQCLSLLKENYDKVEILAQKLLAEDSISGNELKELVAI